MFKTSAAPPLKVSEPEPRWPAIVASLAVCVLYFYLPERLTFGPNWLLFVVVAALTIPAMISHRTKRSQMNYVFGLLICAVLIGGVIWSLGALIAGLPAKRESPVELLRAAAGLWVCNVLVFACWYWRLDAGGPSQRDLRQYHTEGAFLFPQMDLPPELKKVHSGWKPGFVDYLFLAFNTSTAFSPTDVPILSRWAKGMMMVQSGISLSTLAILAARAINIL
jgi:hypothetical protein